MNEIFRVLYSPQRAMEHVARERFLAPGLAVVVLWAVLSVASTYTSLQSGFPAIQRQLQQSGINDAQIANSIATGVRVGVPIYAFVAPFINWFFTGLFIFIAGRILNGTGSFRGSLAIFGLALSPQLFATLVGLVIGVLLGNNGGAIASIISIAGFIWMIILAIIGISYNEDFSYERATGACAISCVEEVLVLVVLSIIVGIIFAVIAGNAFNTSWVFGPDLPWG